MAKSTRRTRRRNRSLGALAVALLLVPLAAAPWSGASSGTERKQARGAAPAGRPNILFVLADDLGARDLGFSGSTFNESPNLDAFARAGARFDQAYAPSPVCSPSRAAILTGKDPARLGITTWIPGGEYQNMPLVEPPIPSGLPLGETTLAEVFGAAGYRTFHVGKWHLGGEGHLPTDQGFAVNVGGGEYGQPPKGYYAPYGNAHLKDGPPGEYLEDRLTEEAVRLISSSAKRGTPFLGFVSFYAVHTPIQPAPGPEIDRFRRKAAALPSTPAEILEGGGRTKPRQDDPAYASMVYRLDRNFGRLLAALDRLGLRKNTIVVFTSDNGGLSTLDPAIDLYRSGTPTSNAPLRAGKGWVYEGGIEVPLLIAGPGIRPRRFRDPVVLTDLYATLQDLAGVRGPRNDAVSLEPLLQRGAHPAPRTLFWHFPHYHGSGSRPASAIRRGDWKLVRDYAGDDWELYDLRRDPSERNDVSRRSPAKLGFMQREFRRMAAATNARMPVPRR